MNKYTYRRIIRKLSSKQAKKTIRILYLLMVLCIFYHLIFAKKIIPGVKVGAVRIGGLTHSKAKTKLDEYEKGLTKTLVLENRSQEFTIESEEIGLIYDWDTSISRAFEVGRTGNILIDSKDKIAGLFKTLYIGAFYDYEDEILKSKFMQIQGEVNKSAENAKIVIENDEIKIVSSKEGMKVIPEGLFKLTTSSFDRLSFGNKELPVKKDSPKITETSLLGVFSEVEDIVNNPFKVVYGSREWELSKTQKLDFVDYVGERDLKIAINDSRFEAFVEELSQEINVLPRGRVLELDGDRVVDFELFEDGKEVDVKEFTEGFKDAFFGLDSKVNVSTKVISGPTSKGRYGIFSLLGEGSSKFTGSIPTRIYNLTLAAGRTNGVLVAPGQVYSLNKAVGEISAATGYKIAWVISEGRTVLGEGGGVCQVSTTLFRAVLDSGLPIVMRYPHDYRVHYYEEGSSIGFDATIFQPSIDFKFKNTSPNYILVESSWDLSVPSLTFRIYGTPDGREVEISEPIVTNESPPPAPLYQEDPTLPKGVIKQIDWSAWGANVFFTRTVSREGEVLFEDKFSSVYQPWQAIYLVGTKE